MHARKSHVRFRKGKWTVTGTTPNLEFVSKPDAIDAAVKLANGSTIVVHGRSGQVLRSLNYSHSARQNRIRSVVRSVVASRKRTAVATAPVSPDKN